MHTKHRFFKKQEPQRGFSSLGQPGHLSPPPLLCRLVLLPDLPQWHLLTRDNDDGAPQLPGDEQFISVEMGKLALFKRAQNTLPSQLLDIKVVHVALLESHLRPRITQMTLF